METKKKASVIVIGLAVVALASVLISVNIDAALAPKWVTVPAFIVWLWDFFMVRLCPGAIAIIILFTILYFISTLDDKKKERRHGGNGRS